MLSKEAIRTALNSKAEKGSRLSALAALSLDKLDAETIKDCLELLQESSSLKEDLSTELEGLGKFAMDCSGTGGSGLLRFNTSSSVALLLAACGFKVAKFGGRAASGKSGSFDFLEYLGLGKTLPPSQIADALSVCGLAFIYAPSIYPVLQEIAPLRKELGKPSLFNYIGPLLNPVRPSRRLMGISSDPARKIIASFVGNDKKTQKALLVTGNGNLDEFSLDGPSHFTLIESGNLAELSYQAGFASTEKANSEANGKDSNLAKFNAEAFEQIALGKDLDSDEYKILILNAAAAIYLLDGAGSIESGIALAQECIASGNLAQTLYTCRRFYEQVPD